MTQDLFDPYAPLPDAPAKPGNLPEFSVSDLSNALKRTVEDAFSFVRVRGEISGFKQAGSGHMYLALKDDQAVLDAVCWRGQANRLGIVPEDGMEVIVTGRLTTFPGRSKYQMVIETMEVAGEGALLKLLEDRKKKLAGEGLFDVARKKPIPFLPDVIGIVTSPTGAVIRDIMHRLRDRFPRRVLLWPVLVQGNGAAEQVAAAIDGFNSLLPDGDIPRPDVLIVARGGGSLEDLWAFNEEIVARAVAASDIPVISAVGHETDTTLIDFVSDLRAPTPTGAAEKAVPVRRDLLGQLDEDGLRLDNAMRRLGAEKRSNLDHLARALGDPSRLLEDRSQLLDGWSERLPRAIAGVLAQSRSRLNEAGARLISPREQLSVKRGRLENAGLRFDGAIRGALQTQKSRLDQAAAGLRPLPIKQMIKRETRQIDDMALRLRTAMANRLMRENEGLARYERLLESYSYRNVLRRGFAVLRDDSGAVISHAANLKNGPGYILEMQDGSAAIRRDDGMGHAGGGNGPAGHITASPQAAQPTTGHAQSGAPADDVSAPASIPAPATAVLSDGGSDTAARSESRAKARPARKKDPHPKDDDRQGSLL